MYLRKAKENEADKILEFYKNIINSIKDSEFKPKWNDKYPNLNFIKNAIKNEELYVYSDNNIIISSVVINNKFDNDYSHVKWRVNPKSHEIIVIHTFAIHTEFSRKGISKKLFNEIKNNAINNNKKTIRLDVINGNTGAQRVFEKLGFEYVDSVLINHPIVGLEKFHLYEIEIN